MSILSRIQQVCRKERVALVHEQLPGRGVEISYGLLLSQARVLSSLIPNGIIAVVLPICIEHVLLLLAMPESGKSAIMPLNPELSVREFEYCLSKKVTLLISDGNDSAEAAASKLGVPCARIRIGPDEHILLEYIDCTAPRTSEPIKGIAVVLLTSGTTAMPKAVPLSTQNLLASVDNILATITVEGSDVTVNVMPMHHVHGIVASVLTALCAGSTLILPQDGKFSARRLFPILAEYGVSWFTAVPAIYGILVKTSEERSFPSLRFVRSSSSRLDPKLMARVEALLGVPVIEAYGMTETAYQITSNPCDFAQRREGSVGIPHGSVLVKIVGSGGCELPAGECGEICVRGPNVMAGYLEDAHANLQAFTEGGYFRTGDAGMMDTSGFLSITGRIKERINRGGEKVSPLEIDTVARAFPGIEDAYSFGFPDEIMGESIGLAVIVTPRSHVSEQELREYISTHLAKYKVPTKIFFQQTLPRTATGKVQRTALAKYFSLA